MKNIPLRSNSNSLRKLDTIPFYLSEYSKRRKLKGAEREIVLKVIDELIRLNENDESTIVFRGEDKEKVFRRVKRFSRKKDDHLFGIRRNEDDIIDRIFMVSNKPKAYFRNNQLELKNRDYLRCITDVSAKTFQFIFDKLNLFFKIPRDKRLSEKTLTVVDRFSIKEKVFQSYFGDRKNKEHFMSNVMKREESVRIEIRDYYLYLLHTIGKHGISNLSFFTSTTTSHFKARKFSNGIIFYGWIPKPVKQFGVSKKSIIEANDLMNRYQLPTYTQQFYPKQKEYSMKGGLFPHYTLGFLDSDKQTFFVNPNLLHEKNKMIISSECPNMILKMGMIIDQSNFEEAIKDSNYGRYVVRYWNGVYEDKLMT